MMNNDLMLSQASRHHKLVINYTNAIRSIIKSYFLKNATNEKDVVYFNNQAIALIGDLKEVIHTTRGLSEVHADDMRKLILLLETFKTSLVITEKEYKITFSSDAFVKEVAMAC